MATVTYDPQADALDISFADVPKARKCTPA
jgi:hypothetical protein